jgi:hypothetical protein
MKCDRCAVDCRGSTNIEDHEMIDTTRIGDPYIEKICARCGQVAKWDKCEDCGKRLAGPPRLVGP